MKDWELRARVALQGLERWPLHSCLELLQFCLSDSSPDHTLTPQLRQRKHELDMYNRVCVCVSLSLILCSLDLSVAYIYSQSLTRFYLSKTCVFWEWALYRTLKRDLHLYGFRVSANLSVALKDVIV